MPKMKTRKSANKRFKKTASGKFKYKSQGTRHILTKKSPKRKRNLRHRVVVSKTETPRLKRMLPYAGS
ncbi:LSU ribosomal protein L35p [Olavius algarvensis spirochete endosymbiont]|uniref:50S ribosomal protein L35 n=1 Tax=Olavius algarvensis spirochete endosymbiont TaxID=260710 RepID=UPI00052C3AE1|nr:50S ribosomal protein L35 [Olavius algarvensis spirochete endosymbiont]KGM43904.1 50S ribosomal protein L35 [Alkalispirochaeta odontotermitis]VDB01283.1 LSU ribosomal protein L35p [Olavius algarvensis spirochete endosymbiont]